MDGSCSFAGSGRDTASGEEDEQDEDDDHDSTEVDVDSRCEIQSMHSDYVEEVGDDLRCARCHHVLEEPVIQSSCGDRWHTSCFKQIMLTDNPICPICSEVLDAKACWRDVFADKQLASIQVYCPGKQNGCHWIGQKQFTKKHFLVCGYVEVQCTNDCKESIVRSQLVHHLELWCKFRSVECEYCKNQVKWEEVQTHVDTRCGKQMVECPNNCLQGFSVLREKLQSHLKECTKKKVPCPILRCSSEVPLDQLHSHYEESLVAHIRHVNDGCLATKTAIDTVRVSLEEQIGAIRQQLHEKQSGIESLGERVAESENKMTEISTHLKISQQQTLERCYQSVDGAQREIKEQTAALEEQIRMMTHKLLKMEEIASLQDVRIQQLEGELRIQAQSSGNSQATQHQFSAQDRVIASHDLKLSEHSLRLDMMDCKNTDGVLLWKITEIRRRRRDALSGKTPSIYSQPFYTSSNGYKMCARLYLNGDGMGRGTHISLFFVVMRGEYDALLIWPFQHKVTLILIDQDDRRHISDTFRPDPSSSSFMRPRNEMNVASGCPLFVSLASLDSGGYVRDDVMFIKMVIDTRDAYI